MGRSKRKKKTTGKSNKAALIIAVILTALVIFLARGGFESAYKMFFKTKATHKIPVINISMVALPLQKVKTFYSKFT